MYKKYHRYHTQKQQKSAKQYPNMEIIVNFAAIIIYSDTEKI